MRAFINNIYRTDLGCLRNLKILTLNNCALDYFAPRDLTDKLKIVSLEGNKLDKIDVVFGRKEEEFNMDEVKIERLNLRNNLFKVFPFHAIQISDKLM